MATLIAADLLAVAAILSATPLRPRRHAPAADRVRVEECLHCGVTGPALHPTERR